MEDRGGAGRLIPLIAVVNPWGFKIEEAFLHMITNNAGTGGIQCLDSLI